MPALFRHSELMGRPIRSEGWAEQGVSSLQVARDALTDSPADIVTQAVENYVWEGQFIARSYFPWLRHYLDAEMGRSGETGVWAMLSRVATHFAGAAFPPLAVEVVGPFAEGHADAFMVEGDSRLVRRASGEALPAARWEAVPEAALEALRTAVEQDDRNGARIRLDQYHILCKPLHDGLTEWVWLWMTMVADTHGEDVMFADLTAVGTALRGAALRRQANLPIEELVLQMAMAMRGHRSGPGEEGDIEVIEEPDRYMIRFDACGSGGRMRRVGEIDRLPARQDDPFRFGTVKQPVPASWGQSGVPYYCTHCALWSEVMTTDILGYPARITLFDPDGNHPCAWAIYKRPEDIPQAYFGRIGRERQPERFNRPEPLEG